jgi:hypothetical protein
LEVGDSVVTHDGTAAAIVWLGHRRVDARRHPRPEDVFPVRVRAHALAAGVPIRDVMLSPDHAVWVGGALVPVRLLVNGHAIAQVRVAEIVYWHVELARHDILLADGLPAESYLETGHRAAFANADAVAAHPVFARVPDDRAFAPLLTAGPHLDAIRASLARPASTRLANAG